MRTLEEAIAEREATAWVPACGGTEKPFACKGRILHYLWNTFSKVHAYYDQTNDRFLAQDDLLALGLA